MFAKYGSSETGARYYLGAWYIVRREMFPHTTYQAGRMVTRQGHGVLVGIRQGKGSDDSGFICHRYQLPDTEPQYVPAGYVD
jgi:hypothetical protein